MGNVPSVLGADGVRWIWIAEAQEDSMSELGDSFRERDQHRARRKEKRLGTATANLNAAIEFAEKHDMVLLKNTRYHFTLTIYGTCKSAISYQLYPSTQRIVKLQREIPFLGVSKPWTLLDVVKSAEEARQKHVDHRSSETSEA